MPAVSKAQRRFFAMCEHGASTNKACPDMSKKQFHDFAATKEKHLPQRKKKRRTKGGAVHSLMGT